MAAEPLAGQDLDVRAAPSGTARVLRSLRVVLVVGCTAACALSALVFTGSHGTIDQALGQSAPAVMQVDAVSEALVKADRTAVADIRSGTARLGGTAGEYGNDIAAVHQGLELIAEHNAAGADGIRELELISGLVVSYTAQIQQAYADSQQTGSDSPHGEPELSLVYLRYASSLLHQPGAGILARLKELRKLQDDALERQISSPWVAYGTGLLWLVPTAAAVALLVGAQVLIRRRFRRRVNVWLSLAAVSLVVMTAVAWRSEQANESFAETIDGSFAYVTDRRARQAEAIGLEGRAELQGLLSEVCRKSCAAEVTRTDFLSFAVPTPSDAVPAGVRRTALRSCVRADQGEGLVCFRADAEAADSGLALPVSLIIALGGAAAVLVAFGLRPRINEYRLGRSR